MGQLGERGGPGTTAESVAIARTLVLRVLERAGRPLDASGIYTRVMRWREARELWYPPQALTIALDQLEVERLIERTRIVDRGEIGPAWKLPDPSG